MPPRFLGGGARGVTLVARPPARFAVGDLALGVDAIAEAFAGARAGERALDALDLDHVDSGAENSHPAAILDGAAGRRKDRQVSERLAINRSAILLFMQDWSADRPIGLSG